MNDYGIKPWVSPDMILTGREFGESYIYYVLSCFYTLHDNIYSYISNILLALLLFEQLSCEKNEKMNEKFEKQ